jgi:hypothetical protein
VANSVEDIKKACYNYLDTVDTLLCFISLSCWERLPKPYYSFGHHMLTSPQNKIVKNNEVKPDAVIQFTDKFGLITEIKTSLPENSNYWRKDVDQIIKYDDRLKGWWTVDEYISDYNCVLLIEVNRSLEFKSFLFGLRDKGEITLSDAICGISFVRTPRLSEQIYFEPRWGTIKDQVLYKKLENGISIPIEKVKTYYGNIKFCDHEPEVEWLIAVMWNDVFITKKNEDIYDPATKRYLINVEVNALAHDLQNNFGCIAIRNIPSSNSPNHPGEVEFPKISWVRKALDFLVTIKYAQKISDDEYTIFYRLIRKEIIEYFATLRINEKRKKPEEKEPMLFDEN